MSENNKYQRWYDVDPTLSLAVSFIRNVDDKKQNEVAVIIINKAETMGIEVSDTRIIFKRRWYDENKLLSNALEYLNQADTTQRKVIAIEIIDYLTEL